MTQLQHSQRCHNRKTQHIKLPHLCRRQRIDESKPLKFHESHLGVRPVEHAGVIQSLFGPSPNQESHDTLLAKARPERAISIGTRLRRTCCTDGFLDSTLCNPYCDRMIGMFSTYLQFRSSPKTILAFSETSGSSAF